MNRAALNALTTFGHYRARPFHSQSIIALQICCAGEPPEMDNEEEYEDEEEDLTKDPEEDTYKFLKLLIQSLQQLDRLDETEEVPLISPILSLQSSL